MRSAAVLVATGAIALAACDPNARVPSPQVRQDGSGQAVAGMRAAYQCPARGTELLTTMNRRIVFHGTQAGDPEACLIQGYDRAEPLPYLFPIMPAAADSAPSHRAALRAFFPFTPGKTASYDAFRTESQLQWRMTLRAIGYETIRVPAGTFNVMVVAFDSEGFGGNYSKTSSRWYIDRETWVPVQMIQETERGEGAPRLGFQARSINRTAL